ncbi:MAG: ATP-binding protein [Geminicoccaceae bacterium]
MRQVASLGFYYDEKLPGFHHMHERPSRPKAPTASTSTCLVSILKTGKWDPKQPWAAKAPAIASGLLHQDWKSGGLDVDNPFSVSFVLEAVTALESVDPRVATAPADRQKVEKAQALLKESIRDGSVSLTVERRPYPPSAYLTELVARVLESRALLEDTVRSKTAEWAWGEIDHQLALSLAKSKNTDMFHLIYSIILVANVGDLEKTTPDQNLVLQAALQKFFDEQLPDGTWPRSRPLFHYPGVGNAYCFEYEMLTQLLQSSSLRDRLLHYLSNLSKAAFALEDTAYPLPDGGHGWASGHHPQFQGPESWSTASAYHFAYGLDRLAAEAIRKVVFEDLQVPYTPPSRPRSAYQDFAPKFLDSRFPYRGQERSFKEVLYNAFVLPISTEALKVEAGASMLEQTPTSAILFGPPGTSKTVLMSLIAQFLNWPLLTVDPSYFVRGGMDRLQAQAEILFKMLAASERIVVLLDEFDEMVRDRAGSDEILSRFLTTSMLPKLATVNKWRRLVFVVATNYIDKFDLAITRSGRFDLIVPLMPPTLDEKLRNWPEMADMAAKLTELDVLQNDEITKKLTRLTYDEYKTLRTSIMASETDAAAATQIIAKSSCTLDQVVDGHNGKTWAEICETQIQNRTRIPDLPAP